MSIHKGDLVEILQVDGGLDSLRGIVVRGIYEINIAARMQPPGIQSPLREIIKVVDVFVDGTPHHAVPIKFVKRVQGNQI
tara:strand:- start:40 stop:279 length:240 start_codon:yes stop_codon:yes gene_type:complete